MTAADAAALLPPTVDDTEPSDIKALEPVGDPTELMTTVNDGGPTPAWSCSLLHGPLGEDGTVQGMCELADVAYVGAGVLGSAVAMDKVMAKTVLDAAGLPQANWRAVSEVDLAMDGETLIKAVIGELGLPCSSSRPTWGHRSA